MNRRVREPYARWCERLSLLVSASGAVYSISSSAYAVVHCLGSPTFLSISFAFSNLSGNRILSSNLFNALSTRTIGILRFFISVVTYFGLPSCPIVNIGHNFPYFFTTCIDSDCLAALYWCVVVDTFHF